MLRQKIADALMRKVADPRIDPGKTSITRVEVTEDFLTAKVYVSVMGEPADQRLTLRALQHAAGRIQEIAMKDVSLRHTPVLTFCLDEQFKKTMETLSLIQQAMDEIHQKDPQASEATTDCDEQESTA